MVEKLEMKIQCMACTPPTNWDTEEEYKDHLVSFHGTTSADEAMKLERAKKQNTPVDLPPGILVTAAPTPEFTKTMQEIERAKASQQTPPPTPASNLPPKVEPKPLVLKYRFDGNCPKCNNPVRTIVNKFDNKLIANAYCMFCDETIQQIPVEPIANDMIQTLLGIEKEQKEEKKKEVKNG